MKTAMDCSASMSDNAIIPEIFNTTSNTKPAISRLELHHLLLALLFFVVFHANHAEAALIYDEAVSGDLAGDQNTPTPIGNLMLGVNTVQGTHVFPDGQSQGDTFELNLDASLIITSISLDITNFIEDAATRVAATVFSIPPFTVYDQQAFTSDGLLSFATALPLASPGSYAFSVQYATAADINGYDWVWTIETAASAIPEPSVLVLFGLGVLGLVVARRRNS